MIYPDLTQEIPERLGRVHFIGIGGSGMSGIALMMKEAGLEVSGSDRAESYTLAALREAGIPVTIGHAAQNVAGVDTIVFTGALWPDNPEYCAARDAGATLLHRSQALAWLTRGKRLLAVAGAHGKTTTTGMIVSALTALGVSPHFVNGGVVFPVGRSAATGTEPIMVIEADESDRSFLLYDTDIAVITNVDPEHLDFYGSEDAFYDAFIAFARKAGQRLVCCADDAGVQRVLERAQQKEACASTAGVSAAGTDMNGQNDLPPVRTYGTSEDAEVRVSDVCTDGPVRFTLTHGEESAPCQLRVVGAHNALNAAAAAAVLLDFGFTLEQIAPALAAFEGTKRRFELRAHIGEVRIYDDYAHHPTEVAALLKAARSVLNGGRLIAIHQPHLYSRTQLMCAEFAHVLETLADHTVVLAVDGAREDPVEGVTGELVSEKFTDQSKVKYIPEWEYAAKYIADFVQPGDIAITMSCGTVYKIIPQIVAALQERFKEEGQLW